MLRIRPARPSDVEELLELDREAFWALRLELSGRDEPMLRREREYFEFWMRTDPEGALVAEEAGTLVGLNMNHARGRNGWFGPLAVKPRRQGQGVGRQLLEAGLAYLESRNCETIGLDTFGASPVAVSLYLQYGFAVAGANLMLHASTTAGPYPTPPTGLEVRPLERSDLGPVAEIIERQSGFARQPDVEFHLTWERACGFKLCETPSSQLRGFALAMPKKGEGSIGPIYLDATLPLEEGALPLVGACADFFAQQGLPEIRVHAFGDDVRWLNTLFAQGFRLRTLMVRMIRGRLPGPVGRRPSGLFTPFVSEKG